MKNRPSSLDHPSSRDAAAKRRHQAKLIDEIPGACGFSGKHMGNIWEIYLGNMENYDFPHIFDHIIANVYRNP